MFPFVIDGTGAEYRLVEAVVGYRCRLSQLPYGDQGLFLRSATFDSVGGFPDMPIMEDYEFVRRVKRLGRVVTVPERVTTSRRRWQGLGVIRTALPNFRIIFAYHLGVDLRQLAGWYRDSR